MNNPQYFTLGQAAKATGKSKPTISKYISKGKLSVISKSKSGYQIDPAELFRVFTPLQKENSKYLQSLTLKNTPVNSLLQQEVDSLRQQLEQEQIERERERRESKERVTDLKIQRDDLSSKLDKTQATLHNQTLLLEDMRYKAPHSDLSIPSGSNLTKATNNAPLTYATLFIALFTIPLLIYVTKSFWLPFLN